jgi:hypothetical protein
MGFVVTLLAITQVAGTCLRLSKPINVRSWRQIAFCQQFAVTFMSRADWRRCPFTRDTVRDLPVL